MAARQRWLLLIWTLLLAANTLPLWSADCGRAPDSSLDGSPWTDNGDGTLGDQRSQLIWKQCPEGLKGERCKDGLLDYLTWEDALKRAKRSRFAGFDNWRIPKLDELQQLIEPGCELPAVNLAAFPNTPSGWFWFDSAEAANSPRAGQLSFAFGDEFNANQRHIVNLRLVRDATPAPEPTPEGSPATADPSAAEPPTDGQAAAGDAGSGAQPADPQQGTPADQNPAQPAAAAGDGAGTGPTDPAAAPAATPPADPDVPLVTPNQP